MTVAKIRILNGHVTLFPWKIINVKENLTIQGLFEHIVDQYVLRLKEEILEKIKVRCSEAKEQTGDEVELGCVISDIVSIFGSLFTFHIKIFSDKNKSQPVSAFDILKNAAKKRHLPTFTFSQNPKMNDKLKLDILSYISFHKGGWTCDAVSTGKKFIRELSDALWYVDKCGSKTFNSKYTIPAEFFQFVNCFDPVKDKKERILFTYDELNFHNQNLTAYLKMSWIKHPCFTFLKPSLIKFANDLQKYAESPTIVTKYKKLVTAVESTDYWKIINVDQYCPNNSTAKSTYLQNLEEAFTFKIGIYTYHHGNVMNTTFVWKIDPNIDESAAFKKNYEIQNELKSFMPVYATRTMRREFVNTCDMFLGNVEKSRVCRIYKEFTGDSTADESEIDARGTAQDSVIAVDERHHDPIIHLARAISVKDLRNQIVKICPEGTPIPSVQWLRLQFWPKNSWNLSSLQYTGNLPLKFMIQVRQLDLNHIDSHYASAIFCYLKELAIKFKDHTWLVFLDDKHRCKIGELGHPVAAIERGKQVVVTTHETFAISDHDFTKCSLIPSVTMLYAAFQVSSALRHMTELYDILLHTEMHHPFLMLYTDGGPNHKNTFLRVQLSLIAIFIALDLDYLVAVRTPPGHSWKNPVERIMSILNLGMQCVGLMRQKMSEEMEKLISGCNSLEDMREKAKTNHQLEKELLQSMEPIRDLLSNLFTRQSFKDEFFKVFEPATKTEMENFWESVHLVDDSITIKDTSQKKVANKPKLQEFMEHCCQKCLYFFEIKKCGNDECNICRPIRSNPDVFKELKGLPDPIPGPDDHYMSFSEIYEKKTTEEHCSSLQNRKPRNIPSNIEKKEGNGMDFSPTAQFGKNVRTVIKCVECNKPRVLYACHKISEEQFCLLQSFLESIEYTCGITFKGLSELSFSKSRREINVINEDNEKENNNEDIEGTSRNDPIAELFKVVQVNSKHTCDSAIEKPYFVAEIFPQICSVCSIPEDLIQIENELPYCRECHISAGKKKENGKKKVF
ncbi:uncharacterized protein LOC111130598 [Rhizophagus clarus]|uniref:Uncharacterized protein LOC111130598 n=1 Tax=Rhizophagus clarus TaxID=94130 RepID=A0A8H3R3F6_9GLOM|nr:uncharacterized protein LOC111130598 [Rhizophagus clarus]